MNTRNGVFANEGWGGGVFNYNTAFGGVEGSASGIRGLGLPLADPEAAGDDARFPWGEFSVSNVVLQQSLNDLLVPRGFCKLTVDGKIGPRTCGALDRSQPSPLAANPTCENRRATNDFLSPRIPPCGAEALPPFLPPEEDVPPDVPTPVIPPPRQTAPLPEPEPEPEPAPVKEGNSNAMLIVGALALLGITAAVVASGGNKRRS